MSTIANGAQLKELSNKCGNHEKDLLQISFALNKEHDHLTQTLEAQVEIAGDNILVKYVLLNIIYYCVRNNRKN